MPIHKKIIKLETVTKPDIPNINGMIYSKEEFDKCINRIKTNDIKIYLTLTPYPIYKSEFILVKPENIIGEVKEINYDSISVLIDAEKEELIDKYINTGYKPGMRYIGDVNKNIVTNISLICFDMINNYKVNKE